MYIEHFCAGLGNRQTLTAYDKRNGQTFASGVHRINCLGFLTGFRWMLYAWRIACVCKLRLLRAFVCSIIGRRRRTDILSNRFSIYDCY